MKATNYCVRVTRYGPQSAQQRISPHGTSCASHEREKKDTAFLFSRNYNGILNISRANNGNITSRGGRETKERKN